MSQIVYFNGRFLPKEQVYVSPEDRGFLFGDGVYEVVRSYEGKLFQLEPHLERLRYGLTELEIQGVDVERLTDVCRELIERNSLSSGDATVYLQVTRGAAPRTHSFPQPSVPPTVYAEAGRFAPKGDPKVGVSVITVPDTRWARCDIKSVQLLANCLANERARRSGAQEALLVRDGVVLEGSHSSVFFVLDGEVRTAPKSNYILPSITREVVLDICRSEGIPAREMPVHHHQLARVREIFLAGTTVEVTPVVRVDGTPVADGKPGPIATRILQRFQDRTR